MPKNVAKMVDDTDTLVEFYKYSAEHWGFYKYPTEHGVHLQTNPIKSTFATVRLRTKVYQGSGPVWRTCQGLHADRRARAR